MALSNTQQIVERLFYKAIRNVCETEGYSPVITSYTNTQAGQASYNAAMNTILTTKGTAIEVFGSSNPRAKGDKQPCRIVIDLFNISPGEVGNNPVNNFELNSGGTAYKNYSFAPTRNNIQLSITATGFSSADMRILNAIMNKALGSRGYLISSDDYITEIFYQFILMEKTEDSPENMVDYVYNYTIPDIEMVGPIEEPDEVAMIVEITTEFYLGYIDAITNEDYPISTDDTLVIT